MWCKENYLIRCFLRVLFVLLFLLQGEVLVAVVKSDVFGEIYITRGLFKRYLRSSPFVIQSALDLLKPWRQCASHYKLVAQMLGRLPRVDRLLMIGLGGGAFLHAARKLHPGAVLETVDVDPAMLEIARRFFNVPTNAVLVKADAVDYLRRSKKKNKKYDFIFVDVFDGMYPPTHLLNKEFVDLLASSLSPNGMVCMNTARKHPWDSSYRKIKDLFERTFAHTAEMCSLTGKAMPLLPHNVVLLGAKGVSEENETIEKR